MKYSAKRLTILLALFATFFGLVLKLQSIKPRKTVQTIIKLDKAKQCCRVGESVVLKAGIENTTNTSMNFVSHGETYVFTVTNEYNTSLPMKFKIEPPNEAGSFGVSTVYPQQRWFGHQFDLDKLFDLSKSGHYKVTAVATPYRADYYCKESEVLEIEIRD